MEQCFSVVYGKVKADLQKKVKYKGFAMENPISSEVVVSMQFIGETSTSVITINKKALRSLITKLQDLEKKASKIVLDHPELPLK
jgi:DNA-directed RNA polymerase subunit L